MGQIIDLLSNLFKLTKVAAVTLPGLAAAGVLALLFWLPPVDVIPIAEKKFVEPPTLAHQLPCPTVPGTKRVNCADMPKAQDVTGRPACGTSQFILSDFNDCEQCADRQEQLQRRQQADREILGKAGVNFDLLFPDNTGIGTYIQESAARQQYLLDFEKDAFAACAEVEDAWKGLEEQEDTLLATDLTNLEKQRSDLQDAYLGLLKTNNPGAARLQQQLQHTLDEIEWTRERNLRNSGSIKERERRSAELKRDATIIGDRLADPGRLRPRKAVDDYLTGLVNHVVAFILLSLALSLIVGALDRATFDSIYEVLFTSYRRGTPATTTPLTTPAPASQAQAPPVPTLSPGTTPTVTRRVRLRAAWHKVKGWDTFLWVAGILVTAIFCWVLYCQAGYVIRTLLAAMVACFTGIALGHWWVRLQQDKGDQRKARGYSTWQILSFGPAEFEKLPTAENLERPVYDVQNLGFFNRRLAMRDLRLLLTPEQLERQYEEEQKRIAQEKKARGVTVKDSDTHDEAGKPQTPPPQVLQPRYAIGKGIITQAEYQDLKDTYFAQSEISFGLIIPLFLLVFALGKQQFQLCMPAWIFSVLLGVEIILTFLLFWVGMERQDKFGMEYRLLILGHWDKLNEAAAQTAAPKTDITPLRDAVEKALEKMQMQFKPFVVELRKEQGPGSDATPTIKPQKPEKPDPTK